MKKVAFIAAGAAVLGLTVSALAATRAFVVPMEPQYAAQNVFTVENETALENFTGRTNKVSGTVSFDPEARTGSATIMVDGASIDTGVPLRNEHMRSANWFNFDKNPEVKFVSTRITFVSGDRYRVAGNLTINGMTKPATADATVRYTAANDVTKSMGFKGDVVGITARFKVNIIDFGAKHPAIDAGRVAKVLDATVKFVASAQ
jgi:polyisoprenoid-binding protein YceI